MKERPAEAVGIKFRMIVEITLDDEASAREVLGMIDGRLDGWDVESYCVKNVEVVE